MKPLLLVLVTAACSGAAPLVAEDAALARARALLERVGLVDGHNDLPWVLRETVGSDLSRVDLRKRGATVDTDIPRLREGRVSGQFWSVFIPSGLPNPARTQLEQIELARRMIDAYPDTFLLATVAADVERARRQGKIASFLMLVDISHVSPDVMRQVLDLSEAPVIFSHSSARALVDHRRNVPDDVLARMAKNGGVVMVTFIPPFVSKETAAWGKGLETTIFSARTSAEMERIEKDYVALHGPAPVATLAQVADHIEHVARVAGRDHVGIGSDFYGSTDEPAGLADVSRFPDLFAELVRRGFPDADLEKLASGNVLRALRGAEAAAERLSSSRRPSTAAIETVGDRR